MQEMTGGLADEGPALSNYSAVFLEGNGGLLHLLEPCILDDSAVRAGPPKVSPSGEVAEIKNAQLPSQPPPRQLGPTTKASCCRTADEAAASPSFA
jgi:hypothetical protein